jgi:hypothetical protein
MDPLPNSGANWLSSRNQTTSIKAGNARELRRGVPPALGPNRTNSPAIPGNLSPRSPPRLHWRLRRNWRSHRGAVFYSHQVVARHQLHRIQEFERFDPGTKLIPHRLEKGHLVMPDWAVACRPQGRLFCPSEGLNLFDSKPMMLSAVSTNTSSQGRLRPDHGKRAQYYISTALARDMVSRA